jgi:hypothetical protein
MNPKGERELSGRVETLRAFAEGSTLDERLADEVLAAFTAAVRWPSSRSLRALVIRAVRTAMLIELMALGEWAGVAAEQHEADGDADGAEALYAFRSDLGAREETYKAWVAEAEEVGG